MERICSLDERRLFCLDLGDRSCLIRTIEELDLSDHDPLISLCSKASIRSEPLRHVTDRSDDRGLLHDHWD